eukprot:14911508-Alexandrium_andersonii.AAC.1
MQPHHSAAQSTERLNLKRAIERTLLRAMMQRTYKRAPRARNTHIHCDARAEIPAIPGPLGLRGCGRGTRGPLFVSGVTPPNALARAETRCDAML